MIIRPRVRWDLAELFQGRLPARGTLSLGCSSLIAPRGCSRGDHLQCQSRPKPRREVGITCVTSPLRIGSGCSPACRYDTRSPSFWVLADRPVILAQTSANSSRLAHLRGAAPYGPPSENPIRAVRGIHRRDAREHGAFPGRAGFSSSASCTTAQGLRNGTVVLLGAGRGPPYPLYRGVLNAAARQDAGQG